MGIEIHLLEGIVGFNAMDPVRHSGYDGAVVPSCQEILQVLIFALATSLLTSHPLFTSFHLFSLTLSPL